MLRTGDKITLKKETIMKKQLLASILVLGMACSMQETAIPEIAITQTTVILDQMQMPDALGMRILAV